MRAVVVAAKQLCNILTIRQDWRSALSHNNFNPNLKYIGVGLLIADAWCGRGARRSAAGAAAWRRGSVGATRPQPDAPPSCRCSSSSGAAWVPRLSPGGRRRTTRLVLAVARSTARPSAVHTSHLNASYDIAALPSKPNRLLCSSYVSMQTLLEVIMTLSTFFPSNK